MVFIVKWDEFNSLVIGKSCLFISIQFINCVGYVARLAVIREQGTAESVKGQGYVIFQDIILEFCQGGLRKISTNLSQSNRPARSGS